MGADGTIRRTDFYMIHTFEDSELRLLIDGILAVSYTHLDVYKRQLQRSISNDENP